MLSVSSAEFRSNIYSCRTIWKIYFIPIFGSILSTCDSRNLNLNTFCNLTLTSLAMWQPSVLETYGNLTTTYLNKTKGPLRPNYPNTMGDRELITSLTKVGWSSTSQIKTQSFITGSRVLQRLRKGHRNCEHLLRGTHRLWWVAPLFQPTDNQ